MTIAADYSPALMIRLDELEIAITTPSAENPAWPEPAKVIPYSQARLWPSFDRAEDEKESRDDEISILAGRLTSEILRELKLFNGRGSITLGRINIPARSFATYEAKQILAKVTSSALLELLIEWDSDNLSRYTYNGKFSVLWGEHTGRTLMSSDQDPLKR